MGWEGCAPRRAVSTNQGFARRPQEFLGWEEGDWEEEWVRYVGGGRGWEWRGGGRRGLGGVPGLGGVGLGEGVGLGMLVRPGRAGPGAPNKGFARRPQRLLAWEEWEWECVGTWACINKAGRALVTRGA